MNKNKHLLKAIIFIVVIITVLILARMFGFGEKLVLIRYWIKSLGFIGIVVFVIMYAIATLFAVPASALTIAAASLFGSFKGVIIVSLASTSGASLSFLASRYFARGLVKEFVSRNEKFKRLDTLTREHGKVIVAITRLLPIFPYTLLNYGFGLTQIKFSSYVLWTWLCMLPGTILYVVGTDAIAKSISEGKVPWLLIGILFIIIVLISLIVKNARKRMKREGIRNEE